MRHESLHTGFSLLELLVVLAIFSIMTALLVANQSNFGANIALNDETYAVSLALREAQTYGLGVKGQGVGAASFKGAYGIHFDKQTPTKFVLFVDNVLPDNTHNGTFDPPDDLILQTYDLAGGVTFHDLCTKQRVPPYGILCGKESIDVTFVRPNPDARIRVAGESDEFAQARICLVARNGRMRQVQVLTSGQVAMIDDCPTI